MSNAPEIPEEFRQLDFFTGDLVDIASRDKRETMNKPFFALSDKPSFEPMEYTSPEIDIIITGSKPYGIATLKDADILIWIISQMIEKRDRGEKVEQKIRFHAHNCLRGVYRRTDGRQYQLFERALKRLMTTTVDITLKDSTTGRRKRSKPFHWLYYDLIYDDKDRVSWIEAVLPSWLYEGVMKQGNVLTIDKRYMLLDSNIERALYKIARVHVGDGRKNNGQWKFRMRQLYELTGSTQRFSNFAIQVRRAVERDQLPEYCMFIQLEGKEEWIIFYKRTMLPPEDERYEDKRVRL